MGIGKEVQSSPFRHQLETSRRIRNRISLLLLNPLCVPVDRVDSPPNRPQIPARGSLGRYLPVLVDHHIPKCPVNSFIRERFHGFDDPLNRRSGKGNEVRITLHEVDAFPQCYLSLVCQNVVDAIWNHHARGGTRKLMIVDADLVAGIELAVTIKRAQMLFLFGVDAENRLTRVEKLIDHESFDFGSQHRFSQDGPADRLCLNRYRMFWRYVIHDPASYLRTAKYWGFSRHKYLGTLVCPCPTHIFRNDAAVDSAVGVLRMILLPRHRAGAVVFLHTTAPHWGGPFKDSPMSDNISLDRDCSTPSPAFSEPDDFLRLLAPIRRHARQAFRSLDPEAREEAEQEVVANAFATYRRLLERGRSHVIAPGPLARFAIVQTRAGRQVGGQLNIDDVTSHYCQHRCGIALESLGMVDEATGAWDQILVEDPSSSPADIAGDLYTQARETIVRGPDEDKITGCCRA